VAEISKGVGIVAEVPNQGVGSTAKGVGVVATIPRDGVVAQI